MKALSCIKLFTCLIKVNRCLCAVKRAVAVLLAAAAVCAAVCCLFDNRRGVKKAVKKLRGMV